MDEPPPTTDGRVDPILARIQPRWPADRTEDNLKATLDRLHRRGRRSGARAPRLFRRLRRRPAH
jgi:hypothetical protein